MLIKKVITRAIIFFLIPFFLLEIIFRVIPVFSNEYNRKVNLYKQLYECNEDKKYIFIGSSRVAAAVDVEVISNYDSSVCQNMGRGYTTAAIHYLGLKYALKQNPKCLKNTKVFIESPKGFCNYFYTWEDEWVNEDSPLLIVPYLDFDSFKDFWTHSTNNFFVKVTVSAHYFFRTIRFLTFIKEILDRNSFIDILTKTGLVESKKSNSILADKGGIKTDSESIEKTRSMAVEYYGSLKSQQPVITSVKWGESIFMDMKKLLKENGSELYMFEIPLSSVQGQAYETAGSRENIEEFSNFRKTQNIQYIAIPFETTDNDFPDLWHISKEKSIEYSKMLSLKIKSDS